MVTAVARRMVHRLRVPTGLWIVALGRLLHLRESCCYSRDDPRVVRSFAALVRHLMLLLQLDSVFATLCNWLWMSYHVSVAFAREACPRNISVIS